MLPKIDTSYLLQTICEQMFARLEFMTLAPQRIVDLSFAEQNVERLKKRYPKAEIIAINAESAILPLDDHSVDLIFANLFLPWCENSKKILAEWQRILRPNGLLIFSSLGPDTLIELREEFVDDFIFHRIDMHDIGDQLIHAKFADPVLDVDYLTVTYQNLATLFCELQNLQLLSSCLVKKTIVPNSENIFPVTYEIIHAHAWGKEFAATSTQNELGEVRIPLAHLRRQNC